MSGLIVEFNGGLKNLYSVIKCEEEDDDDRIGLGDRVKTKHKHIKGTVRFIGRVHYCKDIKKVYVGIECDGPYGRNNGTVKGKTYFTCRNNYGMLARVKDVEKIKKQSPIKTIKEIHNKMKLLNEKKLKQNSNNNMMKKMMMMVDNNNKKKKMKIKDDEKQQEMSKTMKNNIKENDNNNNNNMIKKYQKEKTLKIIETSKQLVNDINNVINNNNNNNNNLMMKKIEEKHEEEEKKQKDTTTTYNAYNDIKVGDYVRTHGYRLKGIVKYIGTVHYKRNNDKIFVGIELDSNRGGKNDGMIKGKRYFQCKNGCRHGIMVCIDDVERLYY